MALVVPRLYVILDSELCAGAEVKIASELQRAGATFFQYRNKSAPARELLQTSQQLAETLIPLGATFFVNDRPDVAYLANASGVHLGQDDLRADEARTMLGSGRFVGVSTHNFEQFRAAVKTSADYIAVGPIFATTTKNRPDPVVGTALLKELRPLTRKPIVAIGGITLERAREVIEAGADSVAVISDILRAPNPAERARNYLNVLETARPIAAE
jgi:thiamine-phosphate pyrophosphorylase